jgi:hypothetical protein
MGTAFLIALLVVSFTSPRINRATPGSEPGLIEIEAQPAIGDLKNTFLYLVTTEGAYRVEPIRPKGAAGHFTGKPIHAPKSFRTAFVFSSENQLKVLSKPVARNAVTVLSADASVIQIRYSDGFIVRKGSATPSMAMHEIESASAITISPAGEEYLLVKWVADSSGCEFRFTLFLLDGDHLTQAASNEYGCH